MVIELITAVCPGVCTCPNLKFAFFIGIMMLINNSYLHVIIAISLAEF